MAVIRDHRPTNLRKPAVGLWEKTRRKEEKITGSSNQLQ